MAWLRELKTPVLPSFFENFAKKDTPAGVFFYGTLGQCQQVLFVI
jgi:hypothetical protein